MTDPFLLGCLLAAFLVARAVEPWLSARCVAPGCATCARAIARAR